MAIETSYLHMRMPPLFVTGILINISALLFSAISTIIFSYFLLSIFCFKTVKKVESLDLFYCHFFYDALFSFTTLLNMIIMLLSQTEAVQFFIDNRNFAFFIVYPVYLTGSMRAIIVLLVEVDRAVANRLALIDIFVIVVFDINPSFVMSFYPNFWEPMGPINSFFKTMGLTVEAFLIRRNLKRQNSKQISNSVVQVA
ncbi:hypothetical protein L3Y34_006879 [Caenorhabditis briggsae]|uniref:Uncharacterized protein n=1 Tax=Caenorhabditis briggsae TaxID=6238 RepID=A0AAE8ZXU1_CAEBR|nr:hypothetical protein L3Y34_006879 [Caenorhabditis briggsae]